MSRQIQFRRGTTVEHSTFTGAVGEVTVDTTKDTVVVHDGSTVGGFPLLRESAYTATDVLTKIKTVDGSGSGLDADLFDGQSSTYYATAASVTAAASGQTITDTTMSKAAFNALASERRANRAGSGFDEFGKHYSGTASYPNVNEGLWTGSSYIYANKIVLGMKTSTAGLSKTNIPISFVNGNIHNIDGLYISDTYTNWILLPPAPTVLPYDATLTPEQIASGVIKHADSSNSGLIVNGKFDVDVGWTKDTGWTISGGVASHVAGAYAYEFLRNTGLQVVAGKKYLIQYTITSRTEGSVLINAGGVNSTPRSEVGTYIEEITAIESGHVSIVSISYAKFTGVIDNIAVFPADAISRSDLVFLESWHEDVSEKGFVYPLGNVQYLGGAVDGLVTPVNGAFSGFDTYSLFGNWQASGALIGNGYVWSTLTDVQKKAFVANHENNMYLDGDKYIQIRYRVRVVAGWGDDWGFGVDVSRSYALPDYGRMCFNDINRSIKPQGKTVTAYGITDRSLNEYIAPITGNLPTYGHYTSFVVGASVPDTSSGYAHEGKCYALPIALVHRRNQGGYNATYNPHGTRTMTMSPTSISDCFNNANLNTSTGYIGTSTPRPDGLFYDQVSVEDFKPSNKGADLRNSSKKRTAQSIIEEFAPKVIAGTLLYNNNDTTPLTTYKDFMEVRDTSGNRYAMKSKVGNVVNIVDTVANKKGFSVVTKNGKQFLQVADDATSDTTVQMNLSTIKYDIGVFDA